jgi:hypothetical protein
LGAFGGLLDECFGFLFRGFELLDVAVEFADVLADEGVAFALLLGVLVMGGGMGWYGGLAHLLFRRRLPEETPYGLHGWHSLCQALYTPNCRSSVPSSGEGMRRRL